MVDTSHVAFAIGGFDNGRVHPRDAIEEEPWPSPILP
jgi:hypothetical protein